MPIVRAFLALALLGVGGAFAGEEQQDLAAYAEIKTFAPLPELKFASSR